MHLNHRANVLVKHLSDGKFHSGEELGRELGISRAAVRKLLQKLAATFGLTLSAVRSKGYRLNSELCLLDREEILSGMGSSQILLESIEILLSVGSTNTYLLDQCSIAGPPPKGKVRVCLSEMQTDGRGRRGKKWQSPFGQNLYASVLFEFPDELHKLAGFSLAASLAVTRACERIGISTVKVKWPNDLWLNDRKLGGILTEIRGESAGASLVVLGIGVNLQLTDGIQGLIDQNAIGLESVGFHIAQRNMFVSLLLVAVLEVIGRFNTGYFTVFREEWESRNALKGRHVAIQLPQGTVEGIVCGICADGALTVMTSTGVQVVTQGEVSAPG